MREKELKEREVRSKLEKLQKKPVSGKSMLVASEVVSDHLQPLRSLLLERSFRETQKARRHLVWECGCVRQTGDGKPEEVWLCCGDRHQGRIAIISNTNGMWQTTVPSYDVCFLKNHWCSSLCKCYTGEFSCDQCLLCAVGRGGSWDTRLQCLCLPLQI